MARVGTEPPPLKLDERRLRGELDAIPTVARGTSSTPQVDATHQALRQVIAFLSIENVSKIPDDLAARVESPLLRAAQSEPERYLPALKLWHNRGELRDPRALETLRVALWNLVPPTEESPRRDRSSNPDLESRYLETLSPPASQQP